MTKPVLKPRHQRTAFWRESNQSAPSSHVDVDMPQQKKLQALQADQPAKFAQILRLLDLAISAPASVINLGIRSIENALLVHQSGQERQDSFDR